MSTRNSAEPRRRSGVAVAERAPLATPQPDGSFDMIDQGFAFGWALDRANPAARVSVELLDAGRVVAIGQADIRRADLVSGGVGDGGCGFRIALPLELYDGRAHEIAARIHGSGF